MRSVRYSGFDWSTYHPLIYRVARIHCKNRIKISESSILFDVSRKLSVYYNGFRSSSHVYYRLIIGRMYVAPLKSQPSRSFSSSYITIRRIRASLCATLVAADNCFRAAALTPLRYRRSHEPRRSAAYLRRRVRAFDVQGGAAKDRVSRSHGTDLRKAALRCSPRDTTTALLIHGGWATVTDGSIGAARQREKERELRTGLSKLVSAKFGKLSPRVGFKFTGRSRIRRKCATVYCVV